jgi:hypothetical protein
MVYVQAEGEDVIPLFVGFDFTRCKESHRMRISSEGGAELSYGPFQDAAGADNRAVEGEIVCRVAEEERVDISFWGVLPNGKRIEGRLSTELTYDAGYD